MSQDQTKPNDSPDTEKKISHDLSRHDFLKAAAMTAVGAVAAATVVYKSRTVGSHKDITGPSTARKIPELKAASYEGPIDPLVRMQEELRKAMAKPIEQRKWSMVIDTRKCVGCHACTVACIAENKLPPGVVYRPVVQEEIGKFPNVQLRFTPRPCMQCDEPPCVPVCPVNATWKRPDGIVKIDYDQCIGCRYCVAACPYGARTSDFGHHYTDAMPDGVQAYETKPNHEYGKSWSREHHGSPVGNARKCQFCVHRLDQGLLPECVTTCIGRANYFGDINDTDSLVSEMNRKHNQIKLLEEKGTKPVVTYLI